MIWNQLFFKVDDMMLRQWHFSDQSSRQNNGQSKYYMESGYYWNIYWNDTQFKYMIPFQKHPYTDAQVSLIQIIFEILMQNADKVQIDRVHKHLEKTVGTIKFIERTSERSFIRYFLFRIKIL